MLHRASAAAALARPILRRTATSGGRYGGAVRPDTQRRDQPVGIDGVLAAGLVTAAAVLVLSGSAG